MQLPKEKTTLRVHVSENDAACDSVSSSPTSFSIILSLTTPICDTATAATEKTEKT